MDTPIYGYSRGYRIVTITSVILLFITSIALSRSWYINIITVISMAVLITVLIYSWQRASRRIIVMHIKESCFTLDDPAVFTHTIPYTHIEEIRIYAAFTYPMVAFRLQNIEELSIFFLHIPLYNRLWTHRRYHITLQLDTLDHQITAIKTTAMKAGIPVRSELA